VDTSHSVLKFAKQFLAGTLLSRLSGAARDIAMAFCFGSAPEIGAFMVAYRFANLFRRLLGEGSLPASFIPHFSSLEGKRALFFYRDTSFSLLAIVLIVVAVLECLFWGLLSIVSSDWAEILLLSMKMVPGLVFICLYALNSALLQTQKKYFIPGVAPVLFNLCWIFFAFFSGSFPIKEGVHCLAMGVSFAFAFQWSLTSFQVSKSLHLSWGEWLRPQIFSSELRKMVKPALLSILGVGAIQINSALDAIFSRFSDLSGPSYLWYAIRVEQLPLALFGIALSGALLPPLSRAIKEKAITHYAILLKQALFHSAALMVPCTFGLLALGASLLHFLYGHGDFRNSDLQQTLYCLWGYGIGLLPSVMILLMSTGFYAQRLYLIPTVASLGSIVFHILCNGVLVFGFDCGAFSIALSTSLAAFCNCSILGLCIRKYLGVNVFTGFRMFFLKLSFAGFLAASATLFLGYHFFNDGTFSGEFSGSLWARGVQICGMGAIFLGLFALLGRLFQIEELFDLFRNKSNKGLA
jgi:putative peptidoglycan lipid II flippase